MRRLMPKPLVEIKPVPLRSRLESGTDGLLLNPQRIPHRLIHRTNGVQASKTR
jgi:hypothetical protein